MVQKSNLTCHFSVIFLLFLQAKEARFNSADLNIAYRMPVSEYQQLCEYSEALEENWGKPPGNLNSNGQELLIYGQQYGNVFIGVQVGSVKGPLCGMPVLTACVCDESVVAAPEVPLGVTGALHLQDTQPCACVTCDALCSACSPPSVVRVT